MKPKKLLSIILTGMMLLTTASPVLASGNTYENAQAKADIIMVKPTGGVIVNLSPQKEETNSGETASSLLKVQTNKQVDHFIINLKPDGVVRLQSNNQIELQGTQSDGGEVQAEILYKTTGFGKGKIQAEVKGYSNDGRIEFTSLNQIDVLNTEDGTFHSNNGTFELESKHLDKLISLHKINSEQYKNKKKLLMRGNAAITMKTEDSQSSDVTVSGRIQWTDSAGNLHDADSVPVQIYDDDVLFDDLLTTVYTDSNGNYTATVKNDTSPLEKGCDIFVRITSEGKGFTVCPGSSPYPYYIDTDTIHNVKSGKNIDMNITLNNTTDSNTAFCIQQALVMANRYIVQMHGSSFPSIRINFPDSSKGTSCYSSWDGCIHLLRSDRFDWDVIHHEFGHYVQDKLDIANSPGGNHYLTENLADRLGKDKGTRLAWGEGWPTYFAISLQNEEYGSVLNIPNVGDTKYDDTEESVPFEYDLESDDGGIGCGEDNELSVQRILWDLEDGDDDPGDKFRMDGETIWKAIDNADPETLSEAMQAITNSMSMEQKILIGGILTEQNVASRPTAPSDGYKIKNNEIPTFTWTANGSGKIQNNQFNVEFYDSNFSKLIFTSPALSKTSYTPSQDEWSQIQKGLDRTIYWVVNSRQTDDPETGPYISSPSKIIKTAKLDVLFLIDSTGSMWDDIDNVKSSISTIVTNLSSASSDFRAAVADYKDFPRSPYGDISDYPYRAVLGFSSNKSDIITAVNSLYAMGGNDTPEAVYSALMNAIKTKDLGSWRKDAEKIIVLMGDAPPHDPEPITGYTLFTVIKAALDSGVNTEPNPDTFSLSAFASETDTASSPVHIFSIDIGDDSSTKYYFEKLSEGTNGKTFYAANASEVTKSILEAIDSFDDIPDEPVNNAPDVTGAKASTEKLWPVNNKMVPIRILNVTDPDGDPVTISITSITQDEPVEGKTEADASGIGSDTAYLRAKRSGSGNGRVYRINFTATDSKGAVSIGHVYVGVPHDQRENSEIIDDGQNYESTIVGKIS